MEMNIKSQNSPTYRGYTVLGSSIRHHRMMTPQIMITSSSSDDSAFYIIFCHNVQGRRKLIYIGPAAADQRVTPSKLLVRQLPDQPDLFLRPCVKTVKMNT